MTQLTGNTFDPQAPKLLLDHLKLYASLLRLRLRRMQLIGENRHATFIDDSYEKFSSADNRSDQIVLLFSLLHDQLLILDREIDIGLQMEDTLKFNEGLPLKAGFSKNELTVIALRDFAANSLCFLLEYALVQDCIKQCGLEQSVDVHLTKVKSLAKKQLGELRSYRLQLLSNWKETDLPFEIQALVKRAEQLTRKFVPQSTAVQSQMIRTLYQINRKEY